MVQLFEKVNQFVWGGPALLLILVAGIIVTVRTKFVQFRLFPKAMRNLMQKICNKESSSRRALCTALAATVGTGNLAGVAGAIAIGGPGAVFWMWISAILGMGLKFAEATLSVQYRSVNAKGELVGGPMYIICNALGKKWRWLACVYSFFGVAAAFGVGNATQINTLVGSVNAVLTECGVQTNRTINFLIGIILAVLLGLILLGGVGRIGAAAEGLVPFAAALYFLMSAGVLIIRFDMIPTAFASIFCGAFKPSAVTGGIVGSVFQTLRIGVSRGVFTNEAGMGTAGIAHAGAKVKKSAEQGLMGIVEVFLDTIVICTLTALVILCSGVGIPYGQDCGITLTANAFLRVYGEWSQVLLMLSVCCFAFATVLGWGLYGNRCAQYLLGERAWRPIALLQMAVVVLGAILETKSVWILSEIVNGLMVIPALIVMIVLAPKMRPLIKEIC